LQLIVDLEKQQITLPGGERLEFNPDMFCKQCLVKGLDDIGLTLDKADLIRTYEGQRRENCPWLFEDLS
jgi:3-isopropylmalate/(R)-2-methylmalate dehydratase small subunit